MGSRFDDRDTGRGTPNLEIGCKEVKEIASPIAAQ